MYIVIDDRGSDEWTEIYNNKQDAIMAAEKSWNLMCDQDKKDTKAFYVLKSVADNIEADNAFDGNIVKQWK